jgi:methyl-accepting chemotaxis protein
MNISDGISAESARAAADLRTQSRNALITMAFFGLTATLFAGAFSFWISSFKIARPLPQLAQRMDTTRGDLTVEIDGENRYEEAEKKSQAVQLLKDHALESDGLEEQSADNRFSSETEPEQAAQQAVSLEETVPALDVIPAPVKKSAEDATQARQPVVPADEAAKNSAVFTLKPVDRVDAVAILADTDDEEETVPALDVIPAPVKKSAEDAAQARQPVVLAGEGAKNSAVFKPVEPAEATAILAETDDEEEDLAQQTSQITGVFAEIAPRTNLLDPRGGVRQTPASDASPSFAWFARELGALAQRSAEAAEDFKSLISTSATGVNHEVKSSAEIGKLLDRIMAKANQINDVVGSIASGARNQATGIEHVNVATNRIDQVTRQKAAMLEELTAASHSLSRNRSPFPGLIGQSRIGRVVGGNSVRSELQKFAPLTLRQPTKGLAVNNTRPGARNAPAGLASTEQKDGREPLTVNKAAEKNSERLRSLP